jgi:hypothetical protein
MAENKSKDPAAGFLIMAAFNILAAIVFLVFYFLYDTRGGEHSYFLLIAAVVSFVAGVGLLVAYNFFKGKFNVPKR